MYQQRMNWKEYLSTILSKSMSLGYQQRMNWKLRAKEQACWSHANGINKEWIERYIIFNITNLVTNGINKEWIESLNYTAGWYHIFYWYQQRMNWKFIGKRAYATWVFYVSTKNELKETTEKEIAKAVGTTYQQRMNWKTVLSVKPGVPVMYSRINKEWIES